MRSSTAIRPHRRGQRPSQLAAGNGRYSLICATPTRSPRACRDATVSRAVCAARAHHDDDPFRFGMAAVVDHAVAPAGALGELVHRLLHDVGYAA